VAVIGGRMSEFSFLLKRKFWRYICGNKGIVSMFYRPERDVGDSCLK